VRAIVALMQAHYIERSYRIYVINAPFWFTVPWKAISALLRPSTRLKVRTLVI
jgi:hypothetical protein